jgi:LPPG:FO 2-phospho-L-lactate transferase
MKVTALAGGVGGAKLLVGLDRAGVELTAIINTGDDTEVYGVHVSPDVDICTYWLAGLADTERGWGLRDDTFTIVESLSRLGVETWFSLGDRDFATCLFRTGRLADGQPLSSITDEIRSALSVGPTLIPMSDEPVRTRLVTTEGRTLEFQEYFVKERQEPEIGEVRFAGIADAKTAPGVLESIRSADVVVLCPSNPIVSIGPILALPEVRDTLREHPRVLAVTPIIRGAPVKGPADKLMRATGAEVSAAGVATLYADLANEFVIDETDQDQTPAVESLRMRAVLTDTIMVDHDAAQRLAEAIL